MNDASGRVLAPGQEIAPKAIPPRPRLPGSATSIITVKERHAAFRSTRPACSLHRCLSLYRAVP